MITEAFAARDSAYGTATHDSTVIVFISWVAPFYPNKTKLRSSKQVYPAQLLSRLCLSSGTRVCDGSVLNSGYRMCSPRAEVRVIDLLLPIGQKKAPATRQIARRIPPIAFSEPILTNWSAYGWDSQYQGRQLHFFRSAMNLSLGRVAHHISLASWRRGSIL